MNMFQSLKYELDRIENELEESLFYDDRNCVIESLVSEREEIKQKLEAAFPGWEDRRDEWMECLVNYLMEKEV